VVACRWQDGFLQVRLGDVDQGFPRVEPFGSERLVVLGQSQSRQTIFQVAHVGGRASSRGRGGGGVA